MLKFYSICLFSLFSLQTFCQVTDDFTDGDFTSNPIWTGDVSLFTIDNYQLRSNSPSAASYYLSTPSTKATEAQWEFFVNLKFATSGSNYVNIVLMSDASALGTIQNGYFLRIGNTADEISLYKVVGGTATMIIDGTDGIVNSSTNNLFKIRIKRNVSDLWTIEYDKGVLGTYTSGGSVTDNSVSTSAYFGIVIVQSSAASVVNGHFFDDIVVGDIVLDLTPPSLVSAAVTSANQIDVLFSESLDQTSAETVANYVVDQSIGTPTSAILDGTNPALMHLTFASSFVNMQNYMLTTQNIQDLSGNSSAIEQTDFTYLVGEIALPGDIIINEFMADPSPVVGLPEIEFIELYNKTNKVFHLLNWTYSDNSTTGTMGDAWLYPHQYIVLVPFGGDTLYTNTCVLNTFPSLNNTGDDIVIADDNAVVLDKISYTIDWYHDVNKKDGGYTIERINPNHPCSGIDNWHASENTLGGTPNAQNSVFDITPDTIAPSLLSVFADSVDWLNIQFSEQLDSTDLMNLVINFTPSLTIINRIVPTAFASSMLIQVANNFEEDIVYQIELQNVADCWGNTANLSETFILPSPLTSGDLIINEILFDPVTGGYDYVELYNNSKKTVNLKNCYLANYKDSATNLKLITSNNYLVRPNQYVVITQDSMEIKQVYPHYGWGTFIESSFPSYPNDAGFVYFLNASKTTIDHVDYSADWQFKLIADKSGKALERINPSGPSNDKSNWNTASENVEFGTPGIRNSQYLVSTTNSSITIDPTTFSPDNDGYQDFTLFNYLLTESGMVGNILIYDELGHLVKQLVHNFYFDVQGFVKWDGTADDESKAPVGRYIIVFEIHSINSEIQIKEKKVVTISSKIFH